MNQPDVHLAVQDGEAPAARSAELRSLHTQGPWHCLYTRVDDARGYQVCHGDLHGKGERENLANLRLIAAAPELLAAAEAALAYDAEIQGCANNPDRMASHCTAQGQTLDDLYERWIALSSAALAKAGVKP
jgi:hypothetical protein